MQIILLHPRLARAKSVTLRSRHLIVVVCLSAGSIIGGAVLLSHVMLQYHSDGDRAPLLQKLFFSLTKQQREDERKNKFLKENLAFMATKIGEIQARLVRLDALGERVQGLAGIRPEDFSFQDVPGEGGMELSDSAAPQLEIDQLQKALGDLALDVTQRSAYLSAVETSLMSDKSDKMKSRLLLTNQPVDVAYNSSSFGWRMDLFAGHRVFHEGLDYPALTGTPIVAAAGGVVLKAQYHPQFGNMIDIDHGNDIMTRYAHASRLHVKVGDIVQRGQLVADVGTTGRSTGPHLHFEVRVKGVARDPRKFLVRNNNSREKPMVPVLMADR